VPERSGQPNFITEKLGNVPVGNVPVNIPIRASPDPADTGMRSRVTMATRR
jgi:hypothetical protein